MEMGAQIGEIDEICRPLVEISKSGDDEGTSAFLNAFAAMGDKLVTLAKEDEEKGRRLSAGAKLARAATYYITAERMQPAHSEPRRALYAKMLDAFTRGFQLGEENCERVEIPYKHARISGLFVRAEGVEGPAPCLVQINGLDSTKEMIYRVRGPQALARRGVSSLIIDQPGTGEALRLHNLTAVYDSEQWASKVVDWLEARPGRRFQAYRPARRIARRLLRAARGRVRAAFRPRRLLGSQPQLGRGPEAAPCARGRPARAPLLGARLLGVGCRGTWTSSWRSRPRST